MAATSPVLRTDVDLFLNGRLSPDVTLQGYAPGGFWPETVPEGLTGGPFCRWWIQSPGRDAHRQDGLMGRAISNPKIMVVLLDRQKSGDPDFYDGTLGGGKLALGAQRIYTLLHNASVALNGFQFNCFGLNEYSMADVNPQGTRDVMIGYFFQLYIQ